MTRNELLVKLAFTPHTNPDGRYMYQALCAVVELHKPVEVSHNYYKTGLGCSAPSCNNKYDEPDPYPCETIQAIEKELG